MSDARPGDLIAGRYRLLDELGGGGMGIVFRARDDQGGRDVAIKLLRITSSDAARRLQREARATEGLDPARVAQVYEVGETESGQPFLVMEYVEGRMLRAILRDGGLERPEALRILREIATTLSEAHRAGLIHRDVKPDNVIVRGDGRVVLLDFGIVKHLDASEDVAQVTTQLTFEGTMIGTPAYLAPEQALGRDVTPAVDQFALAVTAFELLTGKLPWSATDVTRVLAQLLADTPPPASTLNRGVPKFFDAVLWRALSKSPEARFPTIDDFANALDAAERGEMMASPASQTVEGPAPATVPARAAELAPPKPRRSLRAAALAATLVALAGGVTLIGGRRLVAHPEAARTSVPPPLAVSPQTPLACPIFAVEGIPEFASRLGAAASSLACVRAKWYLGGSDEQVLVPAALLDAPVQPAKDLPDILGAPNAREHTLEVAKTRGLPSLDGTIARGRDTWRVDLVLRAPGGAEIARTVGTEATYLELAMRNAVARLWQTAPLTPRPIDPDVARWTGYPDIETGLTELDLRQVGATAEACATVRRRGAALGRAYYFLSNFCGEQPLVDAGAPVLDESSAAALVTSLSALWATAPTNPFSDAEMRRITLELESMRTSETSRFGRALLGWRAGLLWSFLHETERAHAAMLSAVGDDALLFNGWFELVASARGTSSSDAARALASVWFPQEPLFVKDASTMQSDALEARLHDGQLAYILEPTVPRTLFLGRALAEAGRPEEVRALTVTTPIDEGAPDPDCTAYLLASIDLHDAMFARALTRFETAGAAGLAAVPTLASLLGRQGATAAQWAASFVDEPEAKAGALAQRSAAIGLCMSAGGALAGRCLSRVEKLAGQVNAWGVGGDIFLLGAKRFAGGDVRGAVDTWRPIVGGPNESLVLVLPTTAFEHAGERDLAARIDARKMAYRIFAGVSEAAPREARRAFERGDRARARELAKAVVQAWEVADTAIPAVAEMRTLLAKTGD